MTKDQEIEPEDLQDQEIWSQLRLMVIFAVIGMLLAGAGIVICVADNAAPVIWGTRASAAGTAIRQ
jgi:uncharacterized membrane protein